VEVGRVLTRTTGYLETVTSHSLQPYRGCPLGRSLCGVGCYVQHSWYSTRGRPWGHFLDVRTNAAESFRRTAPAERRWARRTRGAFSIFLSSSTEPFPPQERRFHVTERVLEAMCDEPPDLLVVQSHSHRAADFAGLFGRLRRRTELRVHLSIETDRDRLPGLPPPASSVERRFDAARRLKAAGVPVVITVSPLLPVERPDAFFRRIADAADAVVLDHFIGGDGSADGRRTRKTGLPTAMAAVDPRTADLGYRDAMREVAERHMPGRVGIGVDGFAGRFPERPTPAREAGEVLDDAVGAVPVNVPIRRSALS
ncbi:MAG: hypothetical protein AAGF23_26035, partial [Acidobacteriota bacterium]